MNPKLQTNPPGYGRLPEKIQLFIVQARVFTKPFLSVFSRLAESRHHRLRHARHVRKTRTLLHHPQQEPRHHPARQLGIEEGNETQILQRANFSNMVRTMSIPPGHYMVFRISIQTPEEEGLTNATVFIDTDFHAFLLQFRFRVAKGSLHTVPRELIFESVFPVSHTILPSHLLYISSLDNLRSFEPILAEKYLCLVCGSNHLQS